MVAKTKRAALSVFAVFSFLVFPSAAQSPEIRRDALEDFDFVVETLTENYAGFEDKAAGDKRQSFDAEVSLRRGEVSGAPDTLLKETRALLRWFKDAHLAFVPLAPLAAPSQPANNTAALSQRTPIVRVDEAAHQKEYSRPPRTGEPTGIWATFARDYRVAVIPSPKDPQTFIGVILESQWPEWAPGQVKFEMTKTPAGRWSGLFRLRDH